MTPGKIRDLLEKSKAELIAVELFLQIPMEDWPLSVADTVILRHEVSESVDNVNKALEALDEAMS